jgi:hypothetical protein
MMGRRIAVVGSLLIALVGIPRPSEAGLLELIWEMSGPQMLGLGYGCMFSLRDGSLEQCRVGTNPIMQESHTAMKKGPFLALGASIMGSTGKNSATQHYHWGEIWMLALQPGVAFRSYDNAECAIQVHHGVGVEYEVLFGGDIRTFDKFAFTVTPVDVSFRRVAFGIKLRMYPNGFTDDEFKPGPPIEMNRPFETTVGFTFSLILKKK